MAIVQISKIQQRSGNLVDLPQLDNAEFGWASDQNKLYIGRTDPGPNENIEVLTSYSNISFSQLTGAEGNLDINNAQNGEVLGFDGENWVNKGGNAGGLLTLGEISNVKITGGADGYVISTDGTGNLSFTPKSTIIAFIQNVTKANPAVITTEEENFFVNGSQITITNVTGMTQLNGNTYFADVLTSNTFALYSDPGLTTPIDSSAYGNFPYTSVTATTAITNIITVGDTTDFSANDPVKFVGVTFGDIDANTQYYIKNVVSSTQITISDSIYPNGVAGNTFVVSTDTGSCNIFVSGGRVISSVAGGGAAVAGGANSQIQFNNTNLLDGDPNFTYDYIGGVVTLVGNANVSNLNATSTITGSRLVSNIATGTAPITVTSTTRVANLNVSYSNVSDFEVVTAQTTGTFYPAFVNGNTTANYALGSNANLAFNAATGNLSATILNANGNITGANINTAGTVATPSITNGTSNIRLAASGNVSVSVAGTSNVLVVSSTGANITGTANVTGNANVGNLGAAQVVATSSVTAPLLAATSNVTAPQLISNVSTGTAPLVVTSTTRVSNLNVNYANVSDFNVVTAQTTGTFYPTLINGSTTANYALGANANLSFNAATGALSATLLTGTLTTAAQPNITSIGTLTSLAVTGNVTSGNVYANSGTIGASLLTGTLTTASQPNVTSLGTLSSLTVTGNTTTGGVKTDNYYYANGVAVSFAGTYSNSNVASYLPTYTGNITANNIVASNNITAANFVGAGAGTPTLSSATNLDLSAAVAVRVVGGGSFRMPLLTSAQISALTAANGDMVYNTTSNKFQAYEAGAWSNVGDLTTTIITTGANTTAGTITGNWTLTTGSRLQATYADLAEYYSADEHYSPGTVLEFGGNEEVTLASDATNRVAGVVSTDPAYAMNAKCPGAHPVAIALQGRVPVKVRGSIKKGDMLISGGGGYARPTTNPQMGTVIGKALENFDGVDGVIEIAVGRL